MAKKKDSVVEENIIQNNMVVSMDLVHSNDYNPKKDYNNDSLNMEQYLKVKESLQNHGQVVPILVRELKDGSFEIVNGFHRYSAMKELGWKNVEIKNLGKLTREQAIAKALVTEEIRIPLDQIEVAELIKEYKETGADLTELPYSMEEIESKIELLDFDWESFNKTEKEEEKEKSPISAVMVKCPNCGHEFKS